MNPRVHSAAPEAQIALARVATALAVAAVGVFAIGALAIGRLAIKRVAIKRVAIDSASLKRLHIHELQVDRLRVNQTPAKQESTMLQAFPMYAYIPATDVPRARRFYEQKLGFKPKLETAGGVVYEFGKGTACFLYPTPNAGTSKASQAFWQVDDVEREVAELRSRGVEFERYDDMPGETSETGVVTVGGSKAAWFKDSEGNIMAIIQDY